MKEALVYTAAGSVTTAALTLVVDIIRSSMSPQGFLDWYLTTIRSIWER